MWTLLEIPPQPFGECSICRRHNCGEYKDADGITRQKWLHTPIEMDKGGKLVIGYQCGKSMCDELGLSKEIVKHTVSRPPTDDEIIAYVRSSVERKPVQGDPLQSNVDHIMSMESDAIKAYLAEQKIEFDKRWGIEKLREAAIQHIQGAKL